MLTIVKTRHYPGPFTGFRYVENFRHWIVACVHYAKLGVERPDWSYRIELYACGFFPPNYPLPAPIVDVEIEATHIAFCNETDGYARVIWDDGTLEKLKIR